MYTARIYKIAENGFVGNWNEFESVEFSATPSAKDGVVGKAEVKKALKAYLKGAYVEVYWAAGQTVSHPLYIFK